MHVLRDFGIEFASRYQGLRLRNPVAWGEKGDYIMKAEGLIR